MHILNGKDYTAGTHLPEEEYQKMSAEINEVEAKAYINREFGFEFGRIKIITEVKTYFVKDHRIYPDKTYIRKPQYESTDWNYIRFNCGNWQWEMIDGQLYSYEN